MGSHRAHAQRRSPRRRKAARRSTGRALAAQLALGDAHLARWARVRSRGRATTQRARLLKKTSPCARLPKGGLKRIGQKNKPHADDVARPAQGERRKACPGATTPSAHLIEISAAVDPGAHAVRGSGRLAGGDLSAATITAGNSARQLCRTGFQILQDIEDRPTMISASKWAHGFAMTLPALDRSQKIGALVTRTAVHWRAGTCPRPSSLCGGSSKLVWAPALQARVRPGARSTRETFRLEEVEGAVVATPLRLGAIGSLMR